MRTEQEMLSLITEVARSDENIRAAYLEGSRVNPAVPRDIFQDYDVVYVVNSTLPYREDRTWIDRFGERLYMQYPEDNVFYPSDVENCYGWQIQFADGNRLDLHACTMFYVKDSLELYRILADKDGLLPPPAETNDGRYWVKRPREEEFQSSRSDFWWCLNNVAKGLWREELPYAMDMLNEVLRPELVRQLGWKVGMEQGFSVSIGKSGKYLKNYLSPEAYTRFLATYPPAETNAVWEAVFTMCALFRETEEALCRTLGFSCDDTLAENSLRFLRHVHRLPRDAKEICP